MGPIVLDVFRWWARIVLVTVALLGISIPVQWALGIEEPATAPVHGAVGGVVLLTALAGAFIPIRPGRRLFRWGIPVIVAVVFVLGFGRWVGWWANAGLLAVHVVFGLGIIGIAFHALGPLRRTPRPGESDGESNAGGPGQAPS